MSAVVFEGVWAARRGRSQLAGLAIALMIVAVGRSEASAAKGAPPPELLVSAAVGKPGSLDGLTAYLDAIKPGAGAAVSEQVAQAALAKLIAAPSLDGFDRQAGLYVLVSERDGAPAYALLGKIADAKRLATTAGSARMLVKSGWAVIGDKQLLERIGPYALDAIAALPAPVAPTVTVYLPAVLAHFKPQIEAFRSQLGTHMPPGADLVSRMMTSYVDGFFAMLGQSSQLVATLDAGADGATVDLALVPLPGSSLAAFNALQKPSEYALLDRLPAGTPTIVLGGHCELGPYRDAVLGLVAKFYAPEASKEIVTAMGALAQAMTGESAMAMSFARGRGMTITQLYGTANPTAAHKATAALLGQFKTARTMNLGTMTTTIKANPDTVEHDGVVLRSYDTTSDLSKLPAAQRAMIEGMNGAGPQRTQIGTFDALTLLTLAPDSVGEARRAIDAARGKGSRFTASAPVAQLLDASRAHHDSLAMVLDFGGFVGMITGQPASELPMLMALGFADRHTHLRLSLPAATLRGTIAAVKP